jgi:SOS-response transcriptional repressor LexA
MRLSGLKKVTHLARRIGVDHSVFTNFMNDRGRHKGGKGLLGTKSMQRLERMEREITESMAATPVMQLAEEGTPWRSEAAETPDLRSYLDAIAASPQSAQTLILRTRALEGIGFLPGDWVIVDLQAEPRLGDPVCADLSDPATGAIAETVFRIFEPPFLVASSLAREYRRPIEIDENVTIRGPVVRLPRPTHRSAA